MAYSQALEVLQKDIKSEEEKLGKYCRRCSYEGKKVLMHTATVQWTDDQHVKHSSPILRVCPRCRDIKWLPEQLERSKHQGGYIHAPLKWTEDKGTEKEKTYHSTGFTKLEYADLMKELAIVRDRLHLIKQALQQEDPMMHKAGIPPFDWKQFIRIYLEKI
jgi:phage/plasmid-associated DNA primase